MKIIVDEAGEIIAKATDDHTLIGGQHRLSVAVSLGKRLFWRFKAIAEGYNNFFDELTGFNRYLGMLERNYLLEAVNQAGISFPEFVRTAADPN